MENQLGETTIIERKTTLREERSLYFFDAEWIVNQTNTDLRLLSSNSKYQLCHTDSICVDDNNSESLCLVVYVYKKKTFTSVMLFVFMPCRERKFVQEVFNQALTRGLECHIFTF